MPQVRYIGNKPSKADNVAGTAAVWIGCGDVQEVSDDAWALLSKHDSIWELAEAAPAATGGLSDATTSDPFAGMDDAAVHAFAKERGLKIHHKVNGANLRAAASKALA